jgi:release factor glutamine methyltransferase
MCPDMRIVTLPGVFRPISDSWLLARAVATNVALDRGTAVLDLCTGSGAIGVHTARAGAGAVTAVDASRRAVATARVNARLNGVRVRALRGDLFTAVRGQRFDVIASNPPYVPDPSGDELPTRGARRAWDAGSDGRILLDRIIAEAPEHLREGGRLMVVHSDIIGLDETLAAMTAAGLRDAHVVTTEEGPLGPLMRERADHLRACGRLEPGQRTETVAVLAATR